MSTFLADVVLGLHFTFVFFVVAGLAAVWIGVAFEWQWIRNLWFRRLHLAAIAFVALEAIVGVACPLTLWENALRGTLQETSFMRRYLGPILYHELPEWAFTVAYISFAIAVAITYILIKPKGQHNG
ncbi:MAG: DUF2784 domain-containing protein [Burkholderiales bacterium]|nr:DUF2784 domain-containing protein [Burkholderiales bacterium]MDQ3195497.1 DUF2784 domain-containing protein [Pseudomonadota bacterium]